MVFSMASRYLLTTGAGAFYFILPGTMAAQEIPMCLLRSGRTERYSLFLSSFRMLFLLVLSL